RLLRWTARRLPSADALVEADAGGKMGALLDALIGRLDALPEERLSAEHLDALRERASSYGDQLEALASRSGGREAMARLWAKVEDRRAPAATRLEALNLLASSLEPKDE